MKKTALSIPLEKSRSQPDTSLVGTGLEICQGSFFTVPNICPAIFSPFADSRS